jgi:hypothetical protein
MSTLKPFGRGWRKARKIARLEAAVEHLQTRMSPKGDELGEYGFQINDTVLKSIMSLGGNTMKMQDFTHEIALYCLQVLGKIELVDFFNVRVKTIGGKELTVQMDSANNSVAALKELIFEQVHVQACQKRDVVIMNNMGDLADEAVITGKCIVSMVIVTPIWVMFGGNETTVPENPCINVPGFGDFTEELVSVAFEIVLRL